MQEIAILLSSLAGVATAAAVRKRPRNKTQLLSLGASSHIKNQVNSLKIEKDILTKTISRLYQADSEYSKMQRDKLLLKYQHQLGIVLAKLEKLEAASHHPDLGPVGDGLISLMDQKLARLDDRLYELSSKIQTADIRPKEEKKKESAKDAEKQKEKPESFKFEKTKTPQEPIAKSRHSFEFATLTRFPRESYKQPERQFVKPKENIVEEVVRPRQKVEDKIEIVQSTIESESVVPRTTVKAKPEPPQAPPGPRPDLTREVSKITEYKALPSPKNSAVDDDFEDDGDDDIDKIKGDIMRVLAKLDQAEVE